MNVDGIFLVSSENKDAYCLNPLSSGLSDKFSPIHILNFFDDINNNNGSILRKFAQCEFPAAIISSAAMVNFLGLIRPRETFLCIGVEHGIAPFKSYTYGKHLLASDFYLAPTKGWAERLTRLYPEARSQIRVGGYPKIEAIKAHLESEVSLSGVLAKKIVIILSWGVNEQAFEFLPDLDFIDYILHPADYKLLKSVSLNNARLHVSNPDITYDLISGASIIIGDFSSLTLECIHLGKHVIFMVDRSLYNSNCDMDASFFDKSDPTFGIIPNSDCRISIEGAITAAQFVNLTARFGNDIDGLKAATERAAFDPAFLPPAVSDNIELCANEVSKLLETAGDWVRFEHYSKDTARSAVQSMCFISDSYQAILGRPADRSGLQHYLQKLIALDGGNLQKSISVWHEISKSKEARNRSGGYAREFPRIYFPSSDPLESANTSAAEERLLDALYWISKAIEHDPEHGEYIRLKASLLERMGLHEEALRTACEAQAHGADPEAISSDIDRITTRLNHHAEALGAQLLPNHYRQRRDAAADNAERIRYGVKLAAGSSGHVDDLVQLAHHCADEELLEDACHWITKAIEVEPEQGEYLRFKASILERMNRFEEALVVAHEAEARGAELQSIAADIERINSRIIAELEASARSSDTAVSLAAYSRLLAMKKLPLRDFTKFAGKIIKSYATAH